MNAVVGIVRSDVHRTTHKKSDDRSKLVLYVLAGGVAGMLAGALLGWSGGLLDAQARAAIGSLVALAAVLIAVLGLTGYRVPVLQIDIETPYRWLQGGPRSWAVKNGASLGLGIGSRLGFWLWYAIPLGAFLSATPWLGAVGYGLYSFTRTGAVSGLVTLGRRSSWTGIDVLNLAEKARLVLNAQLLALAVLALAVLGT